MTYFEYTLEQDLCIKSLQNQEPQNASLLVVAINLPYLGAFTNIIRARNGEHYKFLDPLVIKVLVD